MKTVSDDIKDYLISEVGLELTFGSNLFIGRMPTNPDYAVCLYDIEGAIPELAITSEQYYRDALQIVVRANGYVQAITKAWDILNFLQGKANIEIGNCFYTLLRIIQIPVLLEWDENGRALVLCTIETQRR